jgi:hypothetical protein
VSPDAIESSLLADTSLVDPSRSLSSQAVYWDSSAAAATSRSLLLNTAALSQEHQRASQLLGGGASSSSSASSLSSSSSSSSSSTPLGHAHSHQSSLIIQPALASFKGTLAGVTMREVFISRDCDEVEICITIDDLASGRYVLTPLDSPVGGV